MSSTERFLILPTGVTSGLAAYQLKKFSEENLPSGVTNSFLDLVGIFKSLACKWPNLEVYFLGIFFYCGYEFFLAPKTEMLDADYKSW